MSAKRKRFDTRTILMALLVIVVIAAIIVVILNLPAEENILTPEEVLRNPNKYLNKDSIIVKGYYINPTGTPYIVSTLSEIEDRVQLKIDYSNVKNATDILIENSNYIYTFTGILSVDEENPLINQYILIVNKIAEV
ncbi:hypothetical protein AYK20_07260 [Thermoplasmatales archaeon SG8-52-1]|nr:MAG: hypothetical protein AYK20_07260 [Thermoplasmatales archaeon SG8-52-1]